MIADYQARVLENKQLTETVFEIRLELSRPMVWEAGQYISLKVGSGESGVRRSYSICSLPSDQNHINLCVDTKPNGPGSNYIKNLKAGDEVCFKGPLGKFVIGNETMGNEQSMIFVATGCGITPFKAMIPISLNKTNNPNIQLFWGLRHRKDVFYKDFFENLEKEYPNFKFNLVLSDEGHHVTDYLDFLSGDFYVCGNMDLVKEILKGHSAHYESYY